MNYIYSHQVAVSVDSINKNKYNFELFLICVENISQIYYKCRKCVFWFKVEKHKVPFSHWKERNSFYGFIFYPTFLTSQAY